MAKTEVKIVLEDTDLHEGPRPPQRPTLAARDGLVPAEILSVTYKGRAGGKDDGNHVWTVAFSTVDEEKGMGGIALWKHVPVSGKNVNGEKNIGQFYDIMSSAGTSKEKMKEIKDKTVTAESMSKSLKGKIAYVQIRAGIYEDRPPSSSIVAVISKEDYEKGKTSGNFRTRHSYKLDDGEGTSGSGGESKGGSGTNGKANPPPVDTTAAENDLSL